MEKQAKPLYFIAIVPPEPERSRLWELKEDFSSRYATKAALRSPPHITLHMPFRFREDRDEKVVRALTDLAAGWDPVQISLNGYGAFPPRVIYADVEASGELNTLQKDVGVVMKEKFNIFNADYKDRPFRPHLTLAFRDLKKDMFNRAWEELGEASLKMSWTCRSFCLLKHNGKTWDIHKEFSLKAS